MSSQAQEKKHKAKNIAQKEVTELEHRQYRQQFLEASMREHKSWVDNVVYDLVDMRTSPPNNLSKAYGCSQLSARKMESFLHVRLVGYWKAFRISKNLISKLVLLPPHDPVSE